VRKVEPPRRKDAEKIKEKNEKNSGEKKKPLSSFPKNLGVSAVKIFLPQIHLIFTLLSPRSSV
jgi:hypothetical protein